MNCIDGYIWHPVIQSCIVAYADCPVTISLSLNFNSRLTNIMILLFKLDISVCQIVRIALIKLLVLLVMFLILIDQQKLV